MKSPVDFEKLPSKQSIIGMASMKAISLLVEARDRGVPSLASEVSVIIYVEDVNDHAPRFEQSIYQASIPEDLQPGSTILQVRPDSRRLILIWYILLKIMICVAKEGLVCFLIHGIFYYCRYFICPFVLVF